MWSGGISNLICLQCMYSHLYTNMTGKKYHMGTVILYFISFGLYKRHRLCSSKETGAYMEK